MAYPRLRSMNADLHTGLVDGSYKQIAPDRGGFVEKATYDSRAQLHDMYFGIHEAPTKVVPTEPDNRYTTQDTRRIPRAAPWH
jgi:hypothetical protein